MPAVPVQALLLPALSVQATSVPAVRKQALSVPAVRKQALSVPAVRKQALSAPVPAVREQATSVPPQLATRPEQASRRHWRSGSTQVIRWDPRQPVWSSPRAAPPQRTGRGQTACSSCAFGGRGGAVESVLQAAATGSLETDSGLRTGLGTMRLTASDCPTSRC